MIQEKWASLETEAHQKKAAAEILGITFTDHKKKEYAEKQNSESKSTWKTPKPIQAELYPVHSFDAEILLPKVLRDWVMDESDRMPCPPDFVAAAVLVALGSLIGARCAIKPKAKDDWLIVPNLWGGIVGTPSEKKSPAIGVGVKPLDRLVAKAHEDFQKKMNEFLTTEAVFAAKKDAVQCRLKNAAKKQEKAESLEAVADDFQKLQNEAPKPQAMKRFKTNDSTVEKLGELLRENPNGLLVLRDELVGLIASWEKEGREGDRAFFLESWNGTGNFDTDRIGRGSIFIPNLCLSIFGGIQPDKLTGYLEAASNHLANDGMLQRFQLLVYPDHRNWEYRDRYPNKPAKDKAFAVFESLASFDPENWGAAPVDDFSKFPFFRFDPEAQAVFIEWSGDLHSGLIEKEEHPIIAQHLTKFDKLFPALALIFHLVECSSTGKRGFIGKESALRAASWCAYLESHARRCYGLLIDEGLRAARALSDKLKKKCLVDDFTARDIRRHSWRYLTTEETVEAALDWLEDEGWIHGTPTGGTGPGTGRKTLQYNINPLIFGGEK